MMLWGLIALGLLVALPFMREWTRKPMNDAHRRNAPGQFATLSRGVTHYKWSGPDNGPIAIAFHGLSTSSFVFHGIAKELAQMGYRTLTFDLYGRGYSDRPSGPQDAAFFNTQINDLLKTEGVGDDLTVIGYSMGGALAANFAAQDPARIKQMVLLAPAGTIPMEGKLLSFIRKNRVLGNWLMLALYPRTLRKGIAAECALSGSVPDIGDQQLKELNYQGFLPAITASLRGVLADPRTAEHTQIAQAKLPLLAIWGSDDTLIPPAAHKGLTQLNPDAKQEVISGAGHGLTYTHTAEVMGVLKTWLAGI